MNLSLILFTIGILGFVLNRKNIILMLIPVLIVSSLVHIYSMGVYSRMFTFSIPDLTKREFTVLLLLVIPTVLFGIYTAAILDAVHYGVSTLIYSFDFSVISCEES